MTNFGANSGSNSGANSGSNVFESSGYDVNVVVDIAAFRFHFAALSCLDTDRTEFVDTFFYILLLQHQLKILQSYSSNVVR